MSEDFPIGTRVTYDDEPLDSPEVRGTIVLSTDEEQEYAKTYSDPVGPEHGDVLVQWDDDELDRYWERPSDLQKLDEPRRFVKGWRS